jgi:hypothetical protein
MEKYNGVGTAKNDKNSKTIIWHVIVPTSISAQIQNNNQIRRVVIEL